jgi:hypothetical protein
MMCTYHVVDNIISHNNDNINNNKNESSAGVRQEQLSFLTDKSLFGSLSFHEIGNLKSVIMKYKFIK